MRFKIIHTDNFGGDYPNEKFLEIPPLNEGTANDIARLINGALPSDTSRYYKAVSVGYKLIPGFQP